MTESKSEKEYLQKKKEREKHRKSSFMCVFGRVCVFMRAHAIEYMSGVCAFFLVCAFFSCLRFFLCVGVDV